MMIPDKALFSIGAYDDALNCAESILHAILANGMLEALPENEDAATAHNAAMQLLWMLDDKLTATRATLVSIEGKA